MPGARSRRPGRVPVSTGLSTLAGLINDALAALGTQPAFAGSSPLWQSAIETTPVRQSRLGGRTPRPVRSDDTATSGSGQQPTGDSSQGVDEVDIDDDHVEIWKLVRLAQAGDGEAFGVLYDRYVDTVFRFIYYRVNDRALAEDFTSETFLRALRRIGSITYQGRDIGAWFITIARNIVLDHIKSARNRLEMTTADTIETKDHHERSTEAAVLDTLQSERLMEAVNTLGDEQRECIMLRFIQGLSVSETAAVMGKNDGAIKALQHRAVRKLADIVGGELR